MKCLLRNSDEYHCCSIVKISPWCTEKNSLRAGRWDLVKSDQERSIEVKIIVMVGGGVKISGL